MPHGRGHRLRQSVGFTCTWGANSLSLISLEMFWYNLKPGRLSLGSRGALRALQEVQTWITTGFISLLSAVESPYPGGALMTTDARRSRLFVAPTTRPIHWRSLARRHLSVRQLAAERVLPQVISSAIP